MNSFVCFSFSPIALSHPGIAIATTRAGGVGILDREFCRDINLAVKNLDKLLELVKDSDGVGLRLRLDQISSSQTLLERLSNRPHWLILSRWNWETLQDVTSLPLSQSRRLLLEITDIEQLSSLDDLSSLDIQGVVARGHEAGGWVSEDPAFILTQKLLGMQLPYPVYVQGGIGIHTAAACRAAGAAGVVLDDQLWLMPESPLPKQWQSYLNNLNGQEAIAIGERLQPTCRVLSRPGFQVISALQQLAEQVELEQANSAQSWQQLADAFIGWDAPGILAYPMGQAVGLAAHFRDRYQTTGKLVQAIVKNSCEQIKTAQVLQPLAPDAPLATSHRTRYPIMQGPMTRVSDQAEFAQAVAESGALPMLALALMRGEQVKDLLQKTQQVMGDRSWGIGILGFVPQAVREEQLQAVKSIKPPFALIAGGRPDQAAQLETLGIATYIHVPTPTLLEMFLEQGARRFVFEGRECGGHVGPLSSFMLWESMIETLLKHVSVGIEPDIHILFAGGIHDHLSALMISAMAAPLVKRGMRIGVLMGTAYLFTKEAVTCGAIAPGYQQQALACKHTINLETGPGHASRCAITPFAQEFYATRRQMLMAGKSPEEIKNTLEDLTLGRLRIASKGLIRDEQGKIATVEQAKQLTDGMYMTGIVATMRHQVCTLRELHQDVSETSTHLLTTISPEVAAAENLSPSDIAIVGIGTLLPKAQYPETFWENILQKINAITEIPAHRWDWRLYYDPDRTARDKVYSKWGGFIDDVPFDPIRFGIPPKSLKSIDPIQLLTLEAVRRGLADAGYESGDFDRENTSVILGAATGAGDLAFQYATRSHLPLYVDSLSEQTWDRLPEWTEESFPGILLNVAAGRAANRFDFGGVNFAVDAACASSLAAIYLAVRELETGRSNVVIAGGVDTGQSPLAYLTFSKTQALSPRSSPSAFDKSADGIVISEGIVTLVLKRLADAERDGDRIYAVIKAVAGSSDGKALGMTAPRTAGQIRALTRAYHKAGFSPHTLGLYEAHGTGTIAGDKAEAETITLAMKAANAKPKTCAIGSVKTMIGHTKSSAGIAGLVKAALALHHKVLPPHIGVEQPLDIVAEPNSPVYLLKEARPWFNDPHYPRRAGVSAFGFGGTNFHAVLEEYQGQVNSLAPGANTWSYELLVFRAENRETLTKDIASLLQILGKKEVAFNLRDLAYTLAKQALLAEKQNVCLSIVVSSIAELKTALESVLTYLETNEPLPSHIQISWDATVSNQPIAFVFPGQGSQYPDMAREVALYFEQMRSTIETGDRILQHLPKLLSQFIYPPSAYTEAETLQHQQQLTNTHIAQPAIGTIAAGFMDLATSLGLEPSMVCGHSYGEYTALHAAGVLSREDFLRLSATRGSIMTAACSVADGAMAAVQMTREDLLVHLQDFEGVVVANHNAPLQSVISGSKQLVTQVVERLQQLGITAKILPVKGAFHSSLMKSAQTGLVEAIAKANIHPPLIPVYANATAHPYPSQVDQIRNQLSNHLLSTVEFVSQINAMYAAGARIFIELGPKNILTRLVGQILADRNHIAVSLDGQSGSLRSLLLALGKLCTSGVSIQLPALFAGRDVHQLDLSRLESQAKTAQFSPTTWLVNGATSRPITEAVGYMGKLPPLNQETAHTSISKQDLVSQIDRQQAEEKHNSSFPAPESTQVSEPKLPMTSEPIEQPVSSPNPSVVAYQAYQETMRQFLAVQEQVMKQFLSGTQPTIIPTPPVQETKVLLPPSQSKNGNGVKTPSPQLQPIAQPIETNVVDSKPEKTVSPQVVNKLEQKTNGTRYQLEQQQLTQILLQLVSDRTGYPPEMLGLNADMEAELGIDSIKRVEILGALQKTLSEPLASNVRNQIENFTRAKTLNSIIEQLIQKSPSVAKTNGTTPNLLLDTASLTQTLLQLVSDRTGYPPEMLGLNADMEAELGIDSIKRVEILGALQKTLSEPLASNVRNQIENFTRAKTLNSIIEQLLKSVPQEVNRSLGKF